MNTTSQESGKYGDGRSTTGAGTKMSPEGQSDPMSTQSTSMGSQTGSAGSTGTQSGGTGIHSGSQTPGQNTQRGNMQNWSGGGSEAQQHAEGPIARTIENQTAKLPSDLFLWAAAASIGVSAVLEFTGNTEKSRFIGQWVAPFLLLGVYNKLVKTQGSDRTAEGRSGNFNRPAYQGLSGQPASQR